MDENSPENPISRSNTKRHSDGPKFCTKCGSPTNGKDFCPNCGADKNISTMPVQLSRLQESKPPEPYLSGQKGKKNPYIVTAAIVVVLALITVALYAMTLSFGNGTSNTNDDNTPYVPTVKPVEMSTFTSSDYESGNQFMQPDSGNKFVQLTFTIKNNKNTGLSLNPNYFKLDTSDGLTHYYSWEVPRSVPDGLQPGASTTIVIGFEIASNATPEMLYFVG